VSKNSYRGLKGTVVQISALTPGNLSRMYELMDKYYENVARDQFRKDLFKKNAVILLLEKKDKSIQGFSTLQHTEININGRKVFGVFSGDTIVEKQYWGQRVLGNTFLKYMFYQKLKHLLSPVYWLLISKGYKTYLIMANNFPIHYPRFEQTTPPMYKNILDGFYKILYPRDFNPELGVILPNEQTYSLRTGVAEIDKSLIESNPRISFFQNTNPSWRDGIELACVAKMVLWIPFYYGAKSFLKLTFGRIQFRRSPKAVLNEK
jgi:hypothetical protein